MATNRYLEGNFAPVTEEVTEYDLPVDGRIPEALEGRYIRTGPNPIDPPDPTRFHWFVGNGMVHGVELRGGRASWYRNRYVVSPEIAERRGIDAVPTGDGGLFPGSGNTNVVHHAGMILALNELSLPYQLDRQLETLRQVDFGGPLPFGMVAHPKFDPATGDMHVVAYSFTEPRCLYHVIDVTGRLTRTVPVPVAGPVMVHDFGLSAEHVVFFDLPVVFNMDAAMAADPLPYRWAPDYTPRVGVMPRDGDTDDIRWAEVEPCFVYHPLNAFDDNGHVVIDVVRHPSMFERNLSFPDEGPPTLDRWTIDPAAGKVVEERLDDRPQEFPRADERITGTRHRFGYSVGVRQDDDGVDFGGNAILKHDLDKGSVEAHEFGAGKGANEFVFVPASDDAAEDEGWLLGYVYDAATDRSDLVILDAADVTADPLATAHLPRRVPYGFHGNWIPDAAVA